MVDHRSTVCQIPEAITIDNAPDNDLFHRPDREALGIMLQYDGIALLANALDHIVEDLFLCLGATRVLTVHIPVAVTEAFLCQRLGQSGHNTGIKFADRIGGATGETHQHRFFTGIAGNDFLHPVQVGKVSLLTGIDLPEIMAGGMNCNRMAFPGRPLGHTDVFRVHNEKGGFHILLFQNIQQIGCHAAGTIIKG